MTPYRPKRAIGAEQRNRFFLNLAIGAALFLLSVAYFVQINNLVAKNFELRKAQGYFQEHQRSNQQLMVNLTQTRSLDKLEAAVKNLDLVAVDKVSYLKTISGIFALSQRP